MTDVKPIPERHPRVAPTLAIDGASAAIVFYTEVLGATERMRIPAPGGKVAHAELQLGDSLINVVDEAPERGYPGPKAIGGTPVILNVYVEDVDVTFERAVAAGAKPLRPVNNQFYGDRIGWFEDPWGHHWAVALWMRQRCRNEEEKTCRTSHLGLRCIRNSRAAQGPGIRADRDRSDAAVAEARHQRRDARAASPAPAVLSSTSSTDDTRSSRSTYCAVSTRTEQPAASARIRVTHASPANRSGAKNPSAANTSRLPTTWPVSIVSRSRSGTRVTTAPASSPGNMIIHTHGTVP
jgi:PhnB protein